MTAKYITPEDVSPQEAQKVLDFLNVAKTVRELADAVEIPDEGDVGVGQNILDRRKGLGSFTSLQQVYNVPRVGPKKFTEIVTNLREREAQKLLKEIEGYKHWAEKQGLNFTAPTKEQLIRKLAKTDSPMIYYQSWGGSPAPGGTMNYNIGIRNPDPSPCYKLFVHVFFGLANIVPDTDAAITTVDPRFPRLTLPKFAGLRVDPGVTETLSFSIPIPSNIEPSNYLCNSFLFRADWHSLGNYLDRSLFVFEVK